MLLAYGCRGRPRSKTGKLVAVPTKPIRVLIVDDDPLLCSAMRFPLEFGGDREFEVVGTAHDGNAAIDAVHAHRPDVILMDIAMPVLDGLEATRRIRALPNPPEIIIITTLDANDEPLRAARAGAIGFLLKSEDPMEIIKSVKAVAAGEGALSRRTARQLFQHLGNDPQDRERVRARQNVQRLTEREFAVARLVAKGLSNVEIAAHLSLSESTVKTHLSAAQEKLQVNNRVLVAVEMTLAQ